MDRCREIASTVFTWLADSLDRKRRPAIVPLSKFLGPPAPQTSLIFEFPDELILSILSHISPDPQLTGHYARFCIPYSVGISGCYNKRAEFLRPLSQTCRAMRLRFLPWVWERLDVPPRLAWRSEEQTVQQLNTIVNALRTDMFLAISVKFVTVHLPSHGNTYPLFAKCLESLPYIHTLEIGGTDDVNTTLLKNALRRVKLSQIRTLIIPPAAHPLLRHCRDVEDVVCVVKDKDQISDDFVGSLASNRDSKVKRLAIPLASCANPSQFVAACPRLTELTISPYPHDAKITGTGILFDPDGSASSAISELVVACKALPDFDTLQILYFPTAPPHPICWCGNHGPSKEQWKQSLREQAKGMRDLAIVCLKKLKAGCQEGEGRKKTMVRVVNLRSARPRPDCHPCSVKVEEHEV